MQRRLKTSDENNNRKQLLRNARREVLLSTIDLECWFVRRSRVFELFSIFLPMQLDVTCAFLILSFELCNRRDSTGKMKNSFESIETNFVGVTDRNFGTTNSSKTIDFEKFERRTRPWAKRKEKKCVDERRELFLLLFIAMKSVTRDNERKRKKNQNSKQAERSSKIFPRTFTIRRRFSTFDVASCRSLSLVRVHGYCSTRSLLPLDEWELLHFLIGLTLVFSFSNR